MNLTDYTYISIFNFKDHNSKKAFLDFVNGPNGIDVTRKYEGCVLVNLYNSNNDKNRLVMIEQWNSKDKKKCYLEMREKQGIYRYFNTLVNTPIKLELITPISLTSKL